MADKTESKKETLNRLFKENGLLEEDVHKHNHYTIITRAGIEKIQAKNKVTVHYEAVVMERDFAVIKGTFSKEGVPDLETFGSASKETSQNKYYPEMAEKRCLSRGVLKICRFYELGVFGEDEADDFKKQPETPKAAQPKPAPIIIKSEAADTPPSEEPAEEVKYATTKQKEIIIRLLNNPVITRQEKTKMLLNINKLDEERATQVIENLNKVIDEREAQQDAA